MKYRGKGSGYARLPKRVHAPVALHPRGGDGCTGCVIMSLVDVTRTTSIKWGCDVTVYKLLIWILLQGMKCRVICCAWLMT